MRPFIIDPKSYDIVEMRQRSLEMIDEFCSVNKLSPPKVLLNQKAKMPKYMRGYCTHRSLAFSDGVRPAVNPGYSWSFTGYRADMTCAGIAAHELGHWFHIRRRGSLQKFSELAVGAKRVSSYEPNTSEAFAETMRLYVLNPDLLRLASPVRFEAMAAVGAVQLHDAPWRDVLANAGQKRVTAVEKWIQ